MLQCLKQCPDTVHTDTAIGKREPPTSATTTHHCVQVPASLFTRCGLRFHQGYVVLAGPSLMDLSRHLSPSPLGQWGPHLLSASLPALWDAG